MTGARWQEAVLDFWFDEIGEQGWWRHSDTTDAMIAERFGDVRASAKGKRAEAFLGSANEALAAVILFDQFSRNLFRGQAEAFATDGLARSIADGAIDRGYDKDMTAERRQFLYMPFMHSEDIGDQDRSLALFKSLDSDGALKYAYDHHELIERFGRFPHRNAALGRETAPEEKEAVEKGSDW